MSDATTVWDHIVTWIEDTIEHQQKDRQYMKDHDGLPAPGNTDYWGPKAKISALLSKLYHEGHHHGHALAWDTLTKLVEKHSGGEVIMDDIRKELFGE